MDEKLKSETGKKEQFSEWELTTYLFRCTSECTISWSDFKILFASGVNGGIDPPNQNPADALATGC